MPGRGATAQISCGRYIPTGWDEAVTFRLPAGIQVSCEHGIAFVDLPSTIIWFDSAGRHMEQLDHDRPVGEQLLLHFHRSVTSLVRNLSDLGDAYRAIRVVLASQQSSQEGHASSCVRMPAYCPGGVGSSMPCCTSRRCSSPSSMPNSRGVDGCRIACVAGSPGCAPALHPSAWASRPAEFRGPAAANLAAAPPGNSPPLCRGNRSDPNPPAALPLTARFATISPGRPRRGQL